MKWFKPDRSLRPHWREFVSLLDELKPGELGHRRDLARRLIHQNGVTHNVYGDPNGLDRPWSLDFIPLLIAPAQWETLCEGLIQRARLLDRLLADLYGPADTIFSGVLPPELLWANPGFLRPCHGIRVPQGRWLHLYAADLVRNETGQFEVLSDRTQAPSGAGYTLENRIVLSRALPSVFRAMQGAAARAVLRLAAGNSDGTCAGQSRKSAHRSATRRAPTTKLTSNIPFWRGTSVTPSCRETT